VIDRCRQCSISDDLHRFLLARLHMDSLADESNRNAILKVLEKLPEGFENTYDDAMERINQQSTKRKRMAYRLLSWISYAFRSLSLIELQYALAVREDMIEMNEDDLDDEEYLISVCAGLVTVSEGYHQVSLVRRSYLHINMCVVLTESDYTTQEYLQGVSFLLLTLQLVAWRICPFRKFTCCPETPF
jgi:hypothetical protein